MPMVPIHPPSLQRAENATNSALPHSALPQILHTPSGLAIVEIQGTIRSSVPPSQGSADAPPIGKLVFPHHDASKGPDDTSWHKRVHLYIGKHQRLTGEVKKLVKPIAVLQRKADIGDRDELEVAEIVYYKLLFAHRPEPVGGGSHE